MSRLDLPSIWAVKAVGARPDHKCIIGDGMGKTLYLVGCIGIVADGGVRELNGLLSVSFAVSAKGSTIHHAVLRFRRMNEPVEISGITVRTADVLHANAEGVIKIPASCLDKLASKAVQMRLFEHEAHLSLRRTDLSVQEKNQASGGRQSRNTASPIAFPTARREDLDLWQEKSLYWTATP